MTATTTATAKNMDDGNVFQQKINLPPRIKRLPAANMIGNPAKDDALMRLNEEEDVLDVFEEARREQSRLPSAMDIMIETARTSSTLSWNTFKIDGRNDEPIWSNDVDEESVVEETEAQAANETNAIVMEASSEIDEKTDTDISAEISQEGEELNHDTVMQQFKNDCKPSKKGRKGLARLLKFKSKKKNKDTHRSTSDDFNKQREQRNSGGFNLRKRIRMMRKARNPKRSTSSLDRIEEASSSTPIKQSFPTKNVTSNSQQEPTFNSTPATLVPATTPVRCNKTEHDEAEKQDKSPNPARDTPTTAASHVSWTTPEDNRLGTLDDSNGQMVLPPAMPASVVSVKTDYESDCASSVAMDDGQKDKESEEVQGTNEDESPDMDKAPTTTNDGTIELSRNISHVLSEEGQENPSIFTVPNPMPYSSPEVGLNEKVVVEEDGLHPIREEKPDANSAGPVSIGDSLSVSSIHTEPNESKDSLSGDANPDAASGDDASTVLSMNIACNNDSRGVIGTSKDVLVEVSSTIGEDGNDVEVIKCMGLEDIGMENNRSRCPEAEDAKTNSQTSSNKSSKKDGTTVGEDGTTRREQESSKQNSRVSKESENTKETKLSVDSKGTTTTFWSLKSSKASEEGRKRLTRLSRPKIIGTRFKSESGIDANPKDNGGGRHSRSRSMSMSKRFHKKYDSKVVKSNAESSNTNSSPPIRSGGSVRSSATSKGLSKEARAALKWKEENSNGSNASGAGGEVKYMEQLFISPVSTPALSMKGTKGYRSLSQEAQAAIAGKELHESIEVGNKKDQSRYLGLSQNAKNTLAGDHDDVDNADEIEISFGLGGKSKRGRGEQIVISKKQQHVARFRSNRTRSENSSDHSDYTSDEDSYSDGRSTDSFISRNSDYTDSGGASECVFGIPRDEIIEDLTDAFVDTSAHVKQVLANFDIMDGLPMLNDVQNRPATRGNCRRSRAASKKMSRKSGSSSGRKRSSDQKSSESLRRSSQARRSSEHRRRSVAKGQKPRRSFTADETKKSKSSGTARRSSRLNRREA